jgi:hypothetical protein
MNRENTVSGPLRPKSHHEIPVLILERIAEYFGGTFLRSARGVPIAEIQFGDSFGTVASVCWFFRNPKKKRPNHKLVVRWPFPNDRGPQEGFSIECEWPQIMKRDIGQLVERACREIREEGNKREQLRSPRKDPENKEEN